MDEKIHPLYTYFSSSQIQMTDTNKKLFSYLTPSQIKIPIADPATQKKTLHAAAHST
jgi:hypothetical protein